jgi:hypothetical protein
VPEIMLQAAIGYHKEWWPLLPLANGWSALCVQAIAAGFSILGTFGTAEWTLGGQQLVAPIPMAILLLGLAVLYFGPRTPLTTFKASAIGLPDVSVFPVPVAVLIPFIIAVIGFTAAQVRSCAPGLQAGHAEHGTSCRLEEGG